MSKIQRNTGRKKNSSKRVSADAVEIMEHILGDDPKLRELAEQATVNAIVAQVIHQARADAGLTQAQLAELVGTQQTVISRLEDADYEGHSLSMLRRIADALGKRLDVRFVDPDAPRAA